MAIHKKWIAFDFPRWSYKCLFAERAYKMKIVAVYGSSRKKGFSSIAVDYAVKQFGNGRNDIKKYRLAEMNFGGCKGCFACRLKEGCIQRDDMTDLLNDIITADFVILSSPVYCFNLCGNFVKMFERLYPMLEGNKGAAGIPEKKTLKLPYSPRYGVKKCMLILSAGAGAVMCSGVRRRAESNLKHNGFQNLGTVVIDGTYSKKEKSLTNRQKRKIERICGKISASRCI